MSSIDDIVHGELGRGAGESAWTRPWAGEIINDPAAVTGDLFVHIPGIDPDRRFGPVGWTPVPTTEGKFYIPGGGEECAVEFDDDRLPWLSAWIPDGGSVKLGGVVIPEPFKYPKTVTSLPSEPADGEEINYLADATNGVVWRLKYRAASASSHKWEFVGGSPLNTGAPIGSINTESVADVALTAGPTLTVPLAGDYRVGAALKSQMQAGGLVEQRGWLGVGGVLTGSALHSVVTAGAGEGARTSNENTYALAATNVLTIRVSLTSAIKCIFSEGQIRLTPVRVG